MEFVASMGRSSENENKMDDETYLQTCHHGLFGCQPQFL